MKTGVYEALFLTLVMGAVIFFCRICPFLFSRKKNQNRQVNTGGTAASDASNKNAALLKFIEKIVPPAAMTVLTFNAIAQPVQQEFRNILPVLAASVLTVVLHLWRRNPLISIFGGTALYMVLVSVF